MGRSEIGDMEERGKRQEIRRRGKGKRTNGGGDGEEKCGRG